MTAAEPKPKRVVKGKPKVKTGCITCRIRRIKCDEAKPSCQKCTKTGRNCDGYELIKVVDVPSLRSTASPPTRIDDVTAQEVALLSRCFSIKSIHRVDLGCDEEARQLLQASLVDPAVRHAITALRALRSDLEASSSDSGRWFVTSDDPGYEQGLQKYNDALSGLADNLSLPQSYGLKSALLCCQIFISIEQLQGDYHAMAKHIIQGVRIMHEHRARPVMLDGKVLLAQAGLPLLDVYIIKLFAAPCKFADTPSRHDSASPGASDAASVESHGFRSIMPNVRTPLTTIAMSTVTFLDTWSGATTMEQMTELQQEKSSLVDALTAWHGDLQDCRDLDPASLSIAFMRLFYHVLRLVLLSSLSAAPNASSVMHEAAQLQTVADEVGERVQVYRSAG